MRFPWTAFLFLFVKWWIWYNFVNTAAFSCRRVIWLIMCGRGQKFRLRAILPEDWERFHDNDEDSDGARRCDVIHFPRSEEGTRLWTEQEAAAEPEGDNHRFAIETLDGELVGSMNTHSCDTRHGTFKYGVAIFREHWRKGYATEAAKLLLRYYFEELRYQKVTAHIYAFNESSIQLHERLGFQARRKA